MNIMIEDSIRRGWVHRLLAFVPHMLTGSRVVFGAAAVITASDGGLYSAAALITLGAVTDVLDGLLARRLGVASAFGALFDTFTDYLCFIIAPWTLARALVATEGHVIQEALIGLPLLTAAVRYARNSLLIVGQDDPVRELPGLATVFFAFLPVVAVFLDAREIISESLFSASMTVLVVVFSLLMITSVRYPKLTNFWWLPTPILVSLTVMPFLGTRALAGIMLIAGLLYVALGHMLTQKRPGAAARAPSAGRDEAGDELRLLP